MFNPVVYPENLRDAAAVDAAETGLSPSARRARRRGIEERVT
jgi:hypothetical protein